MHVSVHRCAQALSEATANDLICGGNTRSSGHPQTACREPGDNHPRSLTDTPESVVLCRQLAERGAHWAATLRIFTVFFYLLPGSRGAELVWCLLLSGKQVAEDKVALVLHRMTSANKSQCHQRRKEHRLWNTLSKTVCLSGLRPSTEL